MTFPGNTPIELAPLIAPAEDLRNTAALASYMRKTLAAPGYESYVPVWAYFVRSYLRAHARKLKQYGSETSKIAFALAIQSSDMTVLRYFLLLASELSI